MANIKNTNHNFPDPLQIPAFVLSIIGRLNDAGFKAYIVGGAVRDFLLNRPVADWDVATSASNDEIGSVFHDVRHFSLKHETVTLVYEGIHFELTTMTGAGLPSKIIEEDLGHRDFTINAMAFDHSKGLIIDPNNGTGDLNKRIIRAVGDPVERFTEDPLRLLRAIRFTVELGFKIEPGTMKCIHGMSPQIARTAGERIRDELMKILLTPWPSSGFRLLASSGLLKAFLPELTDCLLKRQNSCHRYTIFRHIMETVDRIEPDPALRLAALFHDIAKPVARTRVNGEFHFYGHAEKSALLTGEIMERLRFSREMIRQVTNLVTHHMVEYDSRWSDGAVRRVIRRFSPDPVNLLLSLRRADLSAHGTTSRDLDLLSELEGRIKALSQEFTAGNIRDLALNGKKVMDILALSPGPEVGKALEFLMEKVTDQPDLNTEESLINLLKTMGN
jgi:tRNA nucleotidyltransferase (CCA-adding enzyme)